MANLKAPGQDMVNFTTSVSLSYYEEAKLYMPGGVNSPVRAAKSLSMTPLVVQSSHGSSITDVDGNSYIDYCLSWGAIILGHADSDVNEAVKDQLLLGSSYGALCEKEILLARRLIEHIPHLEKVRFVSSGTEATMSALRLARGFTGRNRICKFNGHYHGHHDALLKNAGSFLLENSAPSSIGVTADSVKETVVLPYNDSKAFDTIIPIAASIAAIIFEPVCGNMGVILPKKDFLEALQAFCKRFDILLIVDEVMTGFRTNFFGAACDFSIDGDLYCYGKIIGGGLPAAFFGGKKVIMDYLAPEGGVFQAGTLSGNPLAMSAGLKVTEKLLENGFYETLQDKAILLLDPIEIFINEHDLDVTLNRYGTMFTLFFGLKKAESLEDLDSMDHETFKAFYKYMFSHGVFLSPSAYEANFISNSHTNNDLILTRNLILDFLSTLVSSASN
jgi:glutamate-1-semialdehyde 2,1-aminomutase